ncbi:hypothetical protein, partial [Metabacillus bambusae]
MPTEHIKYTDVLKQGTDKLNSAIDQANKAETDSLAAVSTAQSAETKANEANAKSDFTQTQLDEVAAASTIDPAVSQMKVDTEGVTHASPDARLRSDHEKVNALLAKKALKTDVDTLTTNKADKTYVDTQFANIVDGSPKGTYATL